MNIAVVASEAVPFAKTGGLGDVIGALPQAMAQHGHDVRVFMPFYQSVKLGAWTTHDSGIALPVEVGKSSYSLGLKYLRDRKLPLQFDFVVNEQLFDRPELYRDPTTRKDYSDNDDRFIFFNKAVLETIKRSGWKPDVFHLHDWQAGLIPAFLKTIFVNDPFLRNIPTVLTIHNLAYHGAFPETSFPKLGLPSELFYATAPFEFYGKVNFLKGAILFADKITTVSPRYSKEIQTPEHGSGLDGVLKERSKDLVGILNGVDYKIWSPSRDRHLPYNYYTANLSGKKMNKVELLRRAGLPVRDSAPLIGVISRLADQKGLDLLAEITDDLFGLNLQMILLGTGDEKYHHLFNQLERKYPDKFRAYLTFDEKLAHLIEAGADVFLMPSRYEPCGLNQMYSLRYGTVPLVREVGGLADTVVPFDPGSGKGTGFVFKEYSSEALLKTLTHAVSMFSKRRLWVKLMKNGMRCDFSWDKAAQAYVDLFQSLNN